MKENLLRFKQNQKYIIFDYETCNLNLASEDNKPWQLSFIVADYNKVYEEKDYYLKWKDLNISEDAARITGFSKKNYEKHAVCPKLALDHFEKYLYDDKIIPLGHNVLGFDIYIHKIHRQLCKKKPNFSYLNRIIDTNCLAKASAEKIKNTSNNKLAWQFSLNNYIKRGLKTSLQQCAKKYSVPFDASKLHNALYDIKINYEVFKKQLWEVEI
jgi:DNA polymerase III epsilon subunit-like protein